MKSAGILVNYAVVDDEVPPGVPDAVGFVEYLKQKLRYELSQLGGGAADIWGAPNGLISGDSRSQQSEQDERSSIEKRKNASILLVVLSRNWLSSPSCLQGVKDFREKFRESEPVEITQKRIVPVGKMPINRTDCTEAFLNNVEYRFYLEGRGDEDFISFFANGVPGPQQYLKSLYNKEAASLARYIWRLAPTLANGLPPLPQSHPPEPLEREPQGFDKPPVAPLPSGQVVRRVFVAKPASDMRGPYLALIRELTGPGRGYEVVPAPESEIPDDGEAAKNYIGSALESAELSIHLLGERPGFAPDGGKPIVEMQLRLAAGPTRQILEHDVSIEPHGQPKPPRVFISYSHDDSAHKERALLFADRLRDDGIDARIDQYVSSPAQGWPTWCENEIRKADFVLMVCTETYHRRVNNEEERDRGHGVLWEARLIRQSLYDAGSSSIKFVPVLFAGASPDHVPAPVRGGSFYSVESPEGYDALLRLLTDQPLAPMPPIGPRKELPPRQRPRDKQYESVRKPWNMVGTMRRLIWAPKVMPDAQIGVAPRDPQAVLAKFLKGSDVLSPEDKLVGDTLVNFVQFVLQQLDAHPPGSGQARIPVEGSVYLGFDENDLDGAELLGKSLSLLNLDHEVTGIQGDLKQKDALRLIQLQKCDAVLLCWSRADEIWIRSFADQLDWKKLGRDRPFSCRSVVQLRPPHEVKDFFRRLPPRRYIDVVIDATNTPPNVETIAELLRAYLLSSP
jgi:hypothetical protein